MASKKVGTLIKEARTEAGLTQEQLARRIAGLSANDISLAERRLVELYRKASTEERKDALKALKGESSLADDIMESLIDSVADMLTGK